MPATAFYPKKGGREVEVKFSLPPPGMPINTGVSSDLVEVEAKIEKKFSFYGKIEAVNNETVYLKTDAYREGKSILFDIIFPYDPKEPTPNPKPYINYCLSNQTEENSCDAFHI